MREDDSITQFSETVTGTVRLEIQEQISSTGEDERCVAACEDCVRHMNFGLNFSLNELHQTRSRDRTLIEGAACYRRLIGKPRGWFKDENHKSQEY